MQYLRAVLIFCIVISGCFCENKKCHTTTKRHTTHQTTTFTNATTTHYTVIPNITTHHTTVTTYHTTPQANITTQRTTAPDTNITTYHTTTPNTNITTHHTTTPYTNITTQHTTPYTNITTHHTTTPNTNITTHHTTSSHTNITTHHTVAPLTNHTTAHHTIYTTQHPTTAPLPYDFFVNDSSGTCLRMTVSLEIITNITAVKQFRIPPPPTTEVFGNCSADKATMNLKFPEGTLNFTFGENVGDNHFYLEKISLILKIKGYLVNATATQHIMNAHLGHSYSCSQVKVDLATTVTMIATGVRVQAFKLHNGEYGKAEVCDPGPNMTIPIVIGVILIVLVLIVVIAYIFGRRRSRVGYQPL